MPISVVVGGQFGSEGKGKVAHLVAREQRARFAVRVGGTNSGHTVVGPDGAVAFRHLPTACLLPAVTSVIPAGHYIDVSTLLSEIKVSGLDGARLAIDPYAWVIQPQDVAEESAAGIGTSIGSTVTGTGAALVRRIQRRGQGTFAKDVPEFSPFIRETSEILVQGVKAGERVVLEGTQGFGLSLLHSRSYPYCTSRDTTAAAFVSEAGLSPLDVDDVILVIRSYPIRVAGASGELPNEITWDELTAESGYELPVVERTTVTKRVRRVARFDSKIVRRAIDHNRPTRIVMNHVDYIDSACARDGRISDRALRFIRHVERELAAPISQVGFGPEHLTSTEKLLLRVQ